MAIKNNEIFYAGEKRIVVITSEITVADGEDYTIEDANYTVKKGSEVYASGPLTVADKDMYFMFEPDEAAAYWVGVSYVVAGHQLHNEHLIVVRSLH